MENGNGERARARTRGRTRRADFRSSNRIPRDCSPRAVIIARAINSPRGYISPQAARILRLDPVPVLFAGSMRCLAGTLVVNSRDCQAGKRLLSIRGGDHARVQEHAHAPT